jgi:hypothetical protein
VIFLELAKYLPEPIESDPTIFRIPGPVDNESLAFNFIYFEKPPEPAVLTIFSVVTHHE